jgi:hypothetical protein
MYAVCNSEELSESGLDRRVVGYIAGPQFRIDSKYTEIVYLTEHEFLNQMLNDRTNFLDSFEAFVLDEAHELRKTTMIILAILSNYIKRYPEKKSRLIVTSATLDTDIFLNYFQDLKTTLVSAETPTHSVEVFYTFFPDLSNSILENTLAHLKLIFEVPRHSPAHLQELRPEQRPPAERLGLLAIHQRDQRSVGPHLPRHRQVLRDHRENAALPHRRAARGTPAQREGPGV